MNVQHGIAEVVPIPDGVRRRLDFADRLRAARKDLMINVEGMARTVGVDRNVYASFEAGKAMPSVEQVLALVAGSGISSRWLLEGVLPMLKPGPGSDAELIANINELARAVRLKRFLTGRIADLRKRLPADWAADIVRAAARPQYYE